MTTSDHCHRQDVAHRLRAPGHGHNKRVNYIGRVRIGDEPAGPQLHVRIDDVEEPRWEAVILDRGSRWRSDEPVHVTLVDEGIYEGWSASALEVAGAGGDMLLRGEEPLTPPVGA